MLQFEVRKRQIIRGKTPGNNKERDYYVKIVKNNNCIGLNLHNNNRIYCCKIVIIVTKFLAITD